MRLYNISISRIYPSSSASIAIFAPLDAQLILKTVVFASLEAQIIKKQRYASLEAQIIVKTIVSASLQAQIMI